MKRILIPLMVLGVCFTVIWKWTLGFSSFTIFSYTLNEAGQLPRTIPDLALKNQNGQEFQLKDRHKYVLINFVYLNCPYVCHKVNNQLEHIYHMFDTTTIPSKLELITVSFDLLHDGISKMKKYRSYFGTDINGWTFAVPNAYSQKSFDQFLHSIGIWKYTSPATGIITHSIYLFLISPEGKIVKVFDPARDGDGTIVEQINSCINERQI